MSVLRVNHLHPDVVAEQFALENGKKITVYRCPYPSEGPVCLRSPQQPAVLRYMYAHFVFTWAEGSSRLDIGHGTIERSAPMWKDQPISGEWSANSLARFGYSWTVRHLRKYQISPGD